MTLKEIYIAIMVSGHKIDGNALRKYSCETADITDTSVGDGWCELTN